MTAFVRFDKHNLIDSTGVHADEIALSSGAETDKDQVALAVSFLSNYGKRKWFIRRGRSSYGLKHVAEAVMGQYISNGALIQAAKELRIRMQRCDARSLNVWLAWQVDPSKITDEQWNRV